MPTGGLGFADMLAVHEAAFRPDPAFWWSSCAVWGSGWINTTTPVVWLQVVCFTVTQSPDVSLQLPKVSRLQRFPQQLTIAAKNGRASFNLSATAESRLCYGVESAAQMTRLCGSKDRSWVWLICVHSCYFITYLFISVIYLFNSRAYRLQNISELSFYWLSVSVWSVVSPVVCVRLCQGEDSGLQKVK